MTTNTSTAHLIDGVALSQKLRTDITARATALKARGITPGLAVILVGENPASQVYVRNKVKGCQDCGFHSVLEKFDATMTEAELLARSRQQEAAQDSPLEQALLVSVAGIAAGLRNTG